jgi:hypothetical protein
MGPTRGEKGQYRRDRRNFNATPTGRSGGRVGSRRRWGPWNLRRSGRGRSGPAFFASSRSG